MADTEEMVGFAAKKINLEMWEFRLTVNRASRDPIKLVEMRIK